MKSAILPAGLENDDLEIYVHDGILKANYKGWKGLFIELPECVTEVFEVEMIADKVAFKSLQEDMNIYESTEMLIQYVKCNYGGHDYNADLSNGKTRREYWDCGCRCQCLSEGRVCKLPKGPCGTLTPRELQITVLIAEGLPDKLIAHQLNISVNTIRSHLENIRRKIAGYNRTDITMFAIKNKLIQY